MSIRRRTRSVTTSIALAMLVGAGLTTAPPAAAADTFTEDLILVPGVDMPNTTPGTWTLDLSGLTSEQARDAAGELSTRLYGDGSPAARYQPLTIQTDFTEELVLAFRVTGVAVAGSLLDVARADPGGSQQQLSWAESHRTHRPDIFYYLNLPAGPQTVTLQVSPAAPPNGTVIVSEYRIVRATADLPAGVQRASWSTPDTVSGGGPWRSELYPASWLPVDGGGSPDAEGRFLHDFSYAGYHSGADSIPEDPPGAVYDVTAAPYNADSTGATDATAAIQAAIDDAGGAGGGIVYLPAGAFNVAPPSGAEASLTIEHSGVVLRGAGDDQTRIVNTAEYMRMKSVIAVQPEGGGDWFEPLLGTTQSLVEDVPLPSKVVTVADAAGFSVGDHVVVRSDNTAEFVAEHGMTGHWDQELDPDIPGGDVNGHTGPAFARTIVAVDTVTDEITLDAPTRYYLLQRDNARIYRISDPIEEVGIEHLSIGMVRNTTPDMGNLAYNTPGTGAYEVHRASLIGFTHAENSWVDAVRSRAVVSGTSHMLSHGVVVLRSRLITIRGVEFASPQYRGEGGNGYLVLIQGSDTLVQDAVLRLGRHNLSVASMYSTGNVFLRPHLYGGTVSLPSDFHRHLSMANLIDGAVLNNDVIQAQYRIAGTIRHGHSTTQSVFWNTRVDATRPARGYGLQSRQFGNGYVVGTSGVAPEVEAYYGSASSSGPEAFFEEDWVEGIGTSDALQPQSLYEDQLDRRLP